MKKPGIGAVCRKRSDTYVVLGILDDECTAFVLFDTGRVGNRCLCHSCLAHTEEVPDVR